MKKVKALWFIAFLLVIAGCHSMKTKTCPWAPVAFEPGTTTITKPSIASLNELTAGASDKTGRIRIFGIFSKAKIAVRSTSEYFNIAAAKLTNFLEPFLISHPGWTITAEKITPSDDSALNHDVEIEFHGYDDPTRHQDVHKKPKREWTTVATMHLDFKKRSALLLRTGRARIDAFLKRKAVRNLYVRLIAHSQPHEGKDRGLQIANRRLDRVVSHLTAKGISRQQILSAQAGDLLEKGKHGVELTFLRKTAVAGIN